MDIYFALQSDADGTPMTGQAANVTVYLSIDGAAFTASTNAAAEIGRGAYKVTLTSAETAFQTLLYAPVCTGAQSNIYQLDAAPVMPTVPTAADNATAVWGAQTKEVTIATAQADTFATATAVANIATAAGAIKAKTDNLPQSPAAVGSEMALTSAAISAVQNGLATSSELSALETHGDSSWATATGFATSSDLSGLSTFNAATDTVTINSTQAAGMATATGFATPSDIPSASDNASAVWSANSRTLTESALTAADVWSYTTRTITDSPDIQAELTTYGAAKTSDIPTTQDIWEYSDRELTSEISVEISSENIADITESVWNAEDRTLTDLTPKPNQKNIVCTPSNVINAYGIPRLENWTNETAGTQAFDDKINTYITLAKEKMATDLNNHINAAIAYIGADNITELCAWLTGYNLYQDDESTDTDSLPETRYNQYLEQIHRIMENI